ncbi:hypothetical protein PIROE2DRAFT_7772 [Piromyces sp. E2]|nr:hypothetical protein PIROE2DRAFT_7772 [Piromyces sp. E2]|eukprot:OUM65232.1 hypothetical protein PIROE2DRAFT_7772 [Piromyces sp. E2]
MDLEQCAATLGKKAYYKKLTKRDLIDVNISIACKFIQSPPEPLALRFTSNLLYGIIKIYNRQVQFCYNDVNHMVSQIKNEFLNGNLNSTLLEISEARPDSITLVERENLNFDDQLPLTLSNGSHERSTTLIEFGWIKNYDKNITENVNVNMKQKKAKKNNISLPEISINITDLHERSFNNDQYYDLLLSQEGLLQESLNIFNNNFLDSEKLSTLNNSENENKENDKFLDIDLLDIQNDENNGNKDIDNKDIMNYLENNPHLLNEIKDIITEEKSMDNTQTNQQGDQILQELNILDPNDFLFKHESNENRTEFKKRKLYKFFDQEISLPGNERYYSNDSFSKLYEINHQEKRIKV